MKSFLKFSVFSILAIGLFAGCKSAHDHDHLDIGGFQLVLNSEVVVEQVRTVVTGNLTVDARTTTETFEIRFIDTEGAVLVITDNDFSANVSSSNSNVVSVNNSDKWEFTLTGGDAGTANLTVSLAHGNHTDFESRPVPVTVVDAGGAE